MIIGDQHMFQALGVRGEMKECPTDEQQHLKEPLNLSGTVENRGEPSYGNRLGRNTEPCPEGCRLSMVDETPQSSQYECNRKQNVSLSSSSSGPGANYKFWRCASRQVLVPAILTVFFIIIITITLVLLLVVEKSKQPLAAPAVLCCPDDWVGYGGKCYYFSEAEGNWTDSQSQCCALNASLAVIDSEQEKDFLLRLKGTFDCWIGLQREPGQPWRWPGGTKFNQQFSIRGGGSCAYLTDEKWLSSSRCGTERSWICSRPVACTMGKGCTKESQV